MKPSAAAVILGLFLGASAAPAAEVRLGVQGTANFADFSYDAVIEAVDFNALTRWGAGAVLEIGLTENLSVVALPMYVGKGAESQELADIQVRVELGYVEVPVLLKYTFGKGDLRPFVSAGPSFGFRNTAQATLRALGREETEDVADQIQSTDFSLWLGVGVEIPAGAARPFLEAGYALGLADIEEVDDLFVDTTLKNRGFHVRAGVTFGL